MLIGLDQARHTVIYLGNPTVGTRGIHHAIVTTLGQTPRFHTSMLVPQAADALALEYAERGRVPVLVIGEAHLLSHAQLEALRMLTNHDMDSGALFACLLVGQPTLRRRVKLGVLAALDQRIAVRFHMSGMNLGNRRLSAPPPRAGQPRRHPVLRRRHHPDPPNQPRLSPGDQ